MNSEQAVDDAPAGEASPVPAVFYWSLWIPAFAAVIWGLSHLFGSRGIGPNAGAPPTDPRGREPTEPAPLPDDDS